MKIAPKLVLSVATAAVALSAVAETPFYMIRLRAPETDDAQTWEETRQALAENPGCADEVWFSTGIGYPPLAKHRERAAKQAKAAEDCRRLGIQLGLQVQATLGHSDSITKTDDVSGWAWCGFTGVSGVACTACSCPRQPAFLAYFEEVGRIYGAYRPTSVWIDDDLRPDNHRPATEASARKGVSGCWCDRCVGDFLAKEGKTYTREELAAAVLADRALAARWNDFTFDSLAEVARRIAVGVHSVSPETRMGFQHCLRADGRQAKIFRAMYEVTGLPVRSRPGGGAYFDHNPYEQLDKAYFLLRQRATLEGVDCIEQFCPEVETCPRTFACRTPRGVLLEAIENLALGMDSLSFLITDSRYEKMAWYGRKFFRTLAANRSFLRDFAAANRGTRPCGLYVDSHQVPWTRTTAGVPLVNGCAVRTGNYAEFVKRNGGKPIDITSASTGDLLGWAKLADEVSGGKLPAVALDPVQAWVMPRVTASGELRTLTVVNTTIDANDPVRFRLRGVPATCTQAVWRALDAQLVAVPVRRDGADAVVTVPSLAAWSAGWLKF